MVNTAPLPFVFLIMAGTAFGMVSNLTGSISAGLWGVGLSVSGAGLWEMKYRLGGAA